MKNIAFLNRDVELRTEDREARHRREWPPTEVSEGYNYEAVQENYVITDNSQDPAHLYAAVAHVDGHADGLPARRAHRVSGRPVRYARAAAGCTAAGHAQPANQVERMKLT